MTADFERLLDLSITVISPSGERVVKGRLTPSRQSMVLPVGTPVAVGDTLRDDKNEFEVMSVTQHPTHVDAIVERRAKASQ